MRNINEKYDFTHIRSLPRQRLETYSVRQDMQAQMMAELRAGAEVEYVAPVYSMDNDPFCQLYPTQEITLQFASGTQNHEIEAICEKHYVDIVRPLPLDNTFIVRVSTQAQADSIVVASRLAEEEKVLLSEANVAVEIQHFYEPSDSRYKDQWHLFHNGGPQLASGAHVDAPKAWDLTRGDRSVIVAIIDDAIDIEHGDFKGTNKIVAPKDFKGRDTNPMPEGGDNHGTACAGVAVAEENGSGVVGIAPACSLMPIRMSSSLDDSAIEELFNWAVDNGASVISCSWGPTAINYPLSLRQRLALQKAATEGRNGKGCVVLFAAGNANRPINGRVNERGWPSNNPNGETHWFDGFASSEYVIAVAACNSLNKKSAYSNWGKEISICAPSNNGHPVMGFSMTYPRIESAFPGRGIFTTDRLGARGYDSTDYTDDFGGTSSACPLAAGVAALVLSANPELSAAAVKDVLQRTADKIVDGAADPQFGFFYGSYNEVGHSPWFGYGKVNAYKAVNEALRLKNSTATPKIEKRSSLRKAIPDNDPIGLSESLNFSESGIIDTISVSVQIDHAYIGDLQLAIESPQGVSVLLHNRSGSGGKSIDTTYDSLQVDSLKIFHNQPFQGTWKLRVKDLARTDTGTLQNWGISILPGQDAAIFIEDIVGIAIPDNESQGLQRSISTAHPGKIRSIEVMVDITHTYIGDLRVMLTTPSGMLIPLHSNTGGSEDNLRATYGSVNHNDLKRLQGQDISGTWSLRVIDSANSDTGKLNRWSLRFVQE